MNIVRGEEFVIFDVETTGLSPSSGDRIVEIAALKIKDLRVVDKFHSLIDPEREISYGAFLVNGISLEMLIGAPKAQEALPSFLEFIDQTCLVGHNIRFDLDFLHHELSLMGKKMKGRRRVIDTLKMARGLLPSLGSYSLLGVAQALGIQDEQQHRAMADVYLTFEVFCRLITLAEEKSINRMSMLSSLFGNQTAEDQEEGQEKVSLIEKAIQNKSELMLSYFSAGRVSITSRKVTPKELIRKGNRIKLVGFCHLRKEERDFRIDRILHLQEL